MLIPPVDIVLVWGKLPASHKTLRLTDLVVGIQLT